MLNSRIGAGSALPPDIEPSGGIASVARDDAQAQALVRRRRGLAEANAQRGRIERCVRSVETHADDHGADDERARRTGRLIEIGLGERLLLQRGTPADWAKAPAAAPASAIDSKTSRDDDVRAMLVSPRKGNKSGAGVSTRARCQAAGLPARTRARALATSGSSAASGMASRSWRMRGVQNRLMWSATLFVACSCG